MQAGGAHMCRLGWSVFSSGREQGGALLTDLVSGHKENKFSS